MTTEERNKLIVDHLRIVDWHATQLAERLPVDYDDLYQAGFFGLEHASHSFDPARGKFSTFCAPRVRGAMIDMVREMDWAPRLVRARAGRMSLIADQLEAESGRPPTQDELAERFGGDSRDFAKHVKDGSTVGTVSLSRQRAENEMGKVLTEEDLLADANTPDPAESIQREDLRRLIFHSLDRADRAIVLMYYYENMTMREIGKAIGVSESRVSQLMTNVMQRLRGQPRLREELEAALEAA